MLRIKIVLLALSLLAVLGVAFTPSLANAQIGELRCGANSAATGDDCKPPANTPSLNTTVGRIINVISSLIAVASVVMIMIGGFRYVTSGGDSNKAATARGTIINAIIGLIIAVFAQVIVRFVLKSVR